MIITREQAGVKKQESKRVEKVISLCSTCKLRHSCEDYLKSKLLSKRGFSIEILECPNYEPE